MGFSDSHPRIYFYDKEGKFTIGSEKKGNIETHDAFEAFLKGIKFVEAEREFKPGVKTKVKQWYVVFIQPDGKEYCWTTRYTGIMFQSFINCISTLEDFSKEIKIKIYLNKKGMSGLNCFYDHNYDWDNRLQWKYQPDELPAIEPILVAGIPYKDPYGNILYNFEPRMEFTKKLVDRINQILKYDPAKDNTNGNHEIDINEENAAIAAEAAKPPQPDDIKF